MALNVLIYRLTQHSIMYICCKGLQHARLLSGSGVSGTPLHFSLNFVKVNGVVITWSKKVNKIHIVVLDLVTIYAYSWA